MAAKKKRAETPAPEETTGPETEGEALDTSEAPRTIEHPVTGSQIPVYRTDQGEALPPQKKPGVV